MRWNYRQINALRVFGGGIWLKKNNDEIDNRRNRIKKNTTKNKGSNHGFDGSGCVVTGAEGE